MICKMPVGDQVKSLPLGPVETSETWYAVNRLGFNQCICYVWGEGVPVPKTVIFATRVMNNQAFWARPSWTR